MRTALCLALLLLCSTAYGQYAQVIAPGAGVCVGPTCGVSVRVNAPPPIMWQPRVQMQPMQYQGSQMYLRQYRTPIRNWWFGRYRVIHQYSPCQNGQCVPQPQL